MTSMVFGTAIVTVCGEGSAWACGAIITPAKTGADIVAATTAAWANLRIMVDPLLEISKIVTHDSGTVRVSSHAVEGLAGKSPVSALCSSPTPQCRTAEAASTAKGVTIMLVLPESW
jgi:hypothetical protein